ncbi:ROK family transcriptional regulator [Phyllobacterium sp. P30BS-XVII]|uniref:ROK family transcriptional regulator n=1 Tax=Phyllobacterium sp. P30BS-XVII TaxID=2587046 RepID=UPI000DDB71F0|nr:ROK family transcriptional regulator [Phyllobacterium sp. P30BS-XVII]MBA8903860.1 putative NBD/HSP70 family sugar kinase [Phyllobacterium sp. P30BS-XVII]
MHDMNMTNAYFYRWWDIRRPVMEGGCSLTNMVEPWSQPISFTDIEYEIIRFIRRNPQKSRTEIATHLNISKSMLTKAVAKFEQINLVNEERSTLENGERGQPPIRLSLNKDRFHSIGVYVSQHYSAVVRADIGGNVHQAYLRELDAEGDAITEIVLNDIARLLAQSSVPPLGIGFAVPAIVGDNGNLFEVTPSQAKLPLANLALAMQIRFELPVYWDNSAYCIAAFEAHQPNHARRCIFYLTLDFGIGGGLVTNGVVFRGAHNQAANIGALIPETGPRPNLTDLAKYLDCPIHNLSDAFLATLFRANDPQLLAWILDRSKNLSMPLAAVTQLFNPDLIILGGFFPREILEEMSKQIDLSVLDTFGRRPLIKPDISVTRLLGPSGIAKAAALLPVQARLLGQRATPEAKASLPLTPVR